MIASVGHEIEAVEAKQLGANVAVLSAQTIADALVDKIKPKKQKVS